MACPQNISIPGLASNVFNVSFLTKIKNDDESELVFVKLLSDKMLEVFRDIFRAYLRYNETKLLVITFPVQMWLSDFAIKISELADKIGFENIHYVKVTIDESTWKNDSDQNDNTYNFVGQNGNYIERKITKLIPETIILKDQPSWYKDSKFVSYKMEITNF
jgi:hypothetical protein